MQSVLIRYRKNSGTYLKGAEFFVTTAAKARELHPDADIVRYEDGGEYDEPKADSEKKATAKKADASDDRMKRAMEGHDVNAEADDEKPAKAEAKATG